MGYYSFYRIIKDITKTIFGKKVWRFILIVLIVFILLFVISQKHVFGVYSDNLTSVTINNTEYELDLDYLISQYDYSFFVWGSNNRITLFCSNSEMFVNITSGSFYVSTVNNGKFCFFQVWRNNLANCVSKWNSTYFDVSLGSHVYANDSYLYVYQSFDNSTASFPTSTYITLSTYDIKDTDNNLVFDSNYSIFIHPSFDTPKSDISNLSFNYLFVSPGSWDLSNPLYLHRLEITNTVNDDENVIYYYGDKILRLDDDSSYYTQFFDSDIYYFSIPKSKFDFDINTSYLLVLDDSPELYTNSVGLIEQDWDNNIFDVASINTTGILTTDDVIKNNTDNINDDLSNTTPDSSISSDIENSLNFDNQNEDLNNINSGFFSRLTTMLSNLLGYNLSEDTSVSIPLPNSEQSIVLHSNIIYNNVTGALRLIINAFWIYIFSFYMWKFINKIYIAVSTGNILDTFSSSGEAITNDML